MIGADLLRALAAFIFIYPVAMSVLWMTLGLSFHRRREGAGGEPADVPGAWAPVTVIVPCHNEARSIEATGAALAALDYPDYRVVFVDDASTDGTAAAVRAMVRRHGRFHLLRLAPGRGKAGAVNAALAAAVTTPLVVVVDADTQLAPDALRRLLAPLHRHPRVGAVTGHPLPANRHNLLEHVQAGEFASIIGLIRRAQRGWGRITTVSGCFSAYRTDLLRAVGGFSLRTATEDIDMTWRVQRRYHEVWYEPRALAWINVPSSLPQFWKQRRRWALGGWHLLRTHAGIWRDWRLRRLWPLYVDFVAGYLWGFAFLGGAALWLAGRLTGLPLAGVSPVPGWYGSVVSMVCLAQFAAALFANRAYDPTLWRSLFWVPWYLLFFFAAGAAAAVYTMPRGLFGSLERAGRWASPERAAVDAMPGGAADALRAPPAS